MRTTMMYCNRALAPGRFDNFYPHPNAVRMCGRNQPILRVQVTEEPMTTDVDRHWGWWEAERQKFVFVYPHQKLLNMCFPYGPEVLEQRGEGVRLPVRIDLLEGQ